MHVCDHVSPSINLATRFYSNGIQIWMQRQITQRRREGDNAVVMKAYIVLLWM